MKLSPTLLNAIAYLEKNPSSFATQTPSVPSLNQKNACIYWLSALSDYWKKEPNLHLLEDGVYGAFWRSATSYMSIEFYKDYACWAYYKEADTNQVYSGTLELSDINAIAFKLSSLME